MPSKALEILVGAFVTIGVAAIFLLTFRVASLDDVGSGPTYHVIGNFDNIGGLKPGAAVTISGVRVGRVSDIAIDPGSFQAVVTLELSQQYSSIPEDTSAKILTAGLLGEQYIGLSPGSGPEPLKDGSELMLTQGALVLENLVSQFISGGDSGDDKLAESIGKLADALKEKTPTPTTP